MVLFEKQRLIPDKGTKMNEGWRSSEKLLKEAVGTQLLGDNRLL